MALSSKSDPCSLGVQVLCRDLWILVGFFRTKLVGQNWVLPLTRFSAQIGVSDLNSLRELYESMQGTARTHTHTQTHTRPPHAPVYSDPSSLYLSVCLSVSLSLSFPPLSLSLSLSLSHVIAASTSCTSTSTRRMPISTRVKPPPQQTHHKPNSLSG